MIYDLERTVIAVPEYMPQKYIRNLKFILLQSMQTFIGAKGVDLHY